MEEKELFELKRKLKHLAGRRGRHTELISVYIPSGYILDKVTGKLSEEQGTAANIKSKTTKKNVTSALEKILQHLKLFKQTPANGLAVFCGNVAEQEGQPDFLLESIVPPKPLTINLYRCSQRFVLSPLEEMIEKRETYGIIVLDRRDANIALLKGRAIETLAKFDSMVPGKQKAGGQSAARFQRQVEGLAQDFYKKVGETATRAFRQIEDLKGILVGGPGPTKQEFLDSGHLSTELQNKILGVIDIGYTGESGIEELISKSEEILAEAEIMKEKKLIEKLLYNIAKDTGLAAYGEEEVRECLKQGAVETLLLSEGLQKLRVSLKCTKCDHSAEDTVEEVPELTCEQCGSAMELETEKDLLEELQDLANTLGTKVELISMDTREGQQLYNLGGVAAFLRFKVHK